jgi:hypothetical protein
MQKRKDYINWQEFNRIMDDEEVPTPENDSPGDSADEALLEVEMGEDYLTDGETAGGKRRKLKLLADTSDIADEESFEDQLDEDIGVLSSPRPDPKDDLDADSDTH